jgi:hypothetical protein
MSLDQEPIAAHIETTLLGMTIAAGYALPRDMRLVTREILDYDETAGRRPAAIIQVTGTNGERVGTGGVSQTTINGRVVLYFDVENGGVKPVTMANAYTKAVTDALLVDRSRGANPYVLDTSIPEQPTALLWKTGQALEATVLFEVLCRHEGGV